MYLFPGLKQAILSNSEIENHASEGYDYGEIFSVNGRIFFTTYLSTSRRGMSQYLYEFIPSNNQTRKVFHYKVPDNPQASIVAVDTMR